MEYGLTFYRNQTAVRYESGAVPASEHLLVAPSTWKVNVADKTSGRRVLFLGTYAPQNVDYYWVAADRRQALANRVASSPESRRRLLPPHVRRVCLCPRTHYTRNFAAPFAARLAAAAAALPWRRFLEILDLRHFSSADLRPLLDDEAQVWSRLLSWDYSGSAEMILRYVDAKILPGYAAVDRGRVFGYSFFVYEGNKGVIGDLYVTNGNRLPNAREVELKLLTHVIETLQQSPGIHRVEAQLLAHEANAVSRPFLDTGFQRHPRLFMTLPLGQSNARENFHAS